MKQQNALFLSECILCRYAVHNAGVGFTLKKAGETGVEVSGERGAGRAGRGRSGGRVHSLGG